MNSTRRANRLERETSPYLLQHAFNPVDFPAGPNPHPAQNYAANGFAYTLTTAPGNQLFYDPTGFVGVSYLLPALSNGGKNATAYRLLMQDTFPSWLFSVKLGATTIWERWDGWTPQNGFQSTIMNSFNHYSLGSCGEWMYHSVAGIDQDPTSAGFKKIIIHPRPDSHLSSASGSLRSISSSGRLIECSRATLMTTRRSRNIGNFA